MYATIALMADKCPTMALGAYSHIGEDMDGRLAVDIDDAL
jgi:hypothetical protein